MPRFDPELAAVAAALPPSDLTDPAAARATNRERHAADPGYPGRDRLVISDRVVPGPDGPVPVRVYRPAGRDGAALPAVLWLHGGAFILGDLDGSDGLCAELSDRAGAVVVNVDYRLAAGTFHGFDAVVPAAAISRRERDRYVTALATALGGEPCARS